MCDFRLSYGRILSRSSKIIIVNRNRKEMLLNSDMFWKPQEAVQGELLGPPPPAQHIYAFPGPSLPDLCGSWLEPGAGEQGPDPAPGGTQSARDMHLALRLMGASG